MSDSLGCLNDIFRDVFEDDSLTITRATTAKDVEGWDSLMHVNLIVTIERALSIKFTSSEVAGFKNVGEMADIVEQRLAQKRA